MDYKKLLALAENKQEALDSFNAKRRAGLNGLGRGPDQSAIAAFKARKEREQREKLLAAQREKDRLLSLRAQSSKSMKKSKMMQSRTKDNDFSKIVVSNDDIEDQRKVEEKIRKKGLIGVKERMKARIEMDQKLAGLTRKEKDRMIARLEKEEPIKVMSKPKLSDIIQKTKEKNISEKTKIQMSSNKPRPNAPTLSYDQLLNLASEKAKNKISLEDAIKDGIVQKKKMRPMTQKEKDAYREEQYYKSRSDKIKLPSQEDLKRRKEIENVVSPSSQQIPKVQTSTSPIKKPISKTSEPLNGSNRNVNTGLKTTKPSSVSSDKNMRPTSNSSTNMNGKSLPNKPVSQAPKFQKPNDYMNRDNRPRPLSMSSQNGDSGRFARPPPVGAYRGQPTKRPPSPPPPPRPRPKLPPIGANYRRGIYDDYDVDQYMEEDDYYDEEDEMADFIDDGPEEQPEEEEYSKAIREIFGYDKRKYRNIVEDDDDDIEEASFSQVMKEEMRSLREGIKEDLEDIRREEEEKKMKALQKKAKLKAQRR